jgi:ribonuclease P protein component
MGSVPEMLRSRRDFAALQQTSKSKVHPLLAARFVQNELGRTRFGFSTGRRLGSSVVRNRVRRRLREAVRALGPRLASGWDVLIVARPGMAGASYDEIRVALERTLRGGGLLDDNGGGA